MALVGNGITACIHSTTAHCNPAAALYSFTAEHVNLIAAHRHLTLLVAATPVSHPSPYGEVFLTSHWGKEKKSHHGGDLII
jgi:hypothetical protein